MEVEAGPGETGGGQSAPEAGNGDAANVDMPAEDVTMTEAGEAKPEQTAEGATNHEADADGGEYQDEEYYDDDEYYEEGEEEEEEEEDPPNTINLRRMNYEQLMARADTYALEEK